MAPERATGPAAWLGVARTRSPDAGPALVGLPRPGGRGLSELAGGTLVPAGCLTTIGQRCVHDDIVLVPDRAAEERAPACNEPQPRSAVVAVDATAREFSLFVVLDRVDVEQRGAVVRELEHDLLPGL